MCGVLALLFPSIAYASLQQYDLVTVYLENSSYMYKHGIADHHKGLAVGYVAFICVLTIVSRQINLLHAEQQQLY